MVRARQSSAAGFTSTAATPMPWKAMSCSHSQPTKAAGLLDLLHERHFMTSLYERQSMRNAGAENVGVEHDDDSDDRAERDRVPRHEAEDDAFVANLLGR